MSNTVAVDDDQTTTPAESTTAPWAPDQGAKAFGAPSATPKQMAKKAAPKTPKQPRARRGKRGQAIEQMSYKPLPVEGEGKKLSKGAQKKAAKLDAAREKEADLAAIRLNGIDGEGEIPKKPWLTLFSGKRARPDEVAETLSDLASMLENGESERAAVDALAQQYSAYDIGEAYGRVVRLLDRGVTLEKAMADQTDAFPPVVRELIAAANMAKDLHRNLRQASIIIIEADSIKTQVKSALFKPGFMMVFLMIFVIAAVQFLLPMTTQMFTGIGTEAPPTTLIIIAVGDVLKWVFGAIILLGLIFALLWQVILKRNAKISLKADEMALKAPLFGDIMRMSVAARFCDVLSACLSVSMSELEALEVAGRASGNKALQQWVDDHRARQAYGIVSFGDVSKTELLPWNFRNRIETTTSMVRRIEILRELAGTFHTKAQERLNRFAERIGPITEGVVVITIVIVVLLIVTPILTFIPTLIETVS